MTRYFCTVLAGVAVWCLEQADQDFVDNLCAAFDVSIVDGVGLGMAYVLAKHTRKNVKCLWT